MTPIDEIKNKNTTSSYVNTKAKELSLSVTTILNDLEFFDYNYKTELTIQYKKRRNKMKHLIPKKKKRKK
jgi:hypothetical protein